MVGIESRLGWYEKLDKPWWRPPPAVLGAVWTPLYALTAVAGARALDHTSGEQRRAFARSYALSLTLSAAWSSLFFGARSPRLALIDVAALDAANLDLLRRAWHADRPAAACLTPYVAWTAFTTALTAAVARRNRDPLTGPVASVAPR
jgi:tryptophan-rich sensory protein